MFIDSKTVPKGSAIKSDICIIGAGAAGISLALQFKNSGHKIVVLESGGFEHDPATQDLHGIESTGLRVSPDSRVRRYGGTTTAWLGIWKYHDPMDFAKRPWVKNSGWPVPYETLLPYYQHASRLGEASESYAFEREKFLFDDQTFKTTIFHRLKNAHLDFGKRFKDEFVRSSDIDVYLGANVTNIAPNKNHSRIENAEVKTLRGNQFLVQADKYILAAGAIENARLLLASSLGNEHDQVGRYYMDHPKGVSGEIKLLRSTRSPLYWGSGKPYWSRIAGIRLADEAQKKHQILNSLLMLIPKGRSFADKLASKFLNRSPKTDTIGVRNFMEQAPDPENRVYLDDRRDAVGARKAKVHWTINRQDKDTMIIFHKLLAGEIASLRIGSFTSPLLDHDQDSLWPIAGDASHHMGTTRMGDDPRFSVVDKNLRIHSTSNLYVAGSSVFPTSGYANPTATIIALALRLADHLKGVQ